MTHGRIEAGARRGSRSFASAARIVLLVGDGHGARVYATEGRFDADLSRGCNVPLAETPGAVDRAHGSRAQLRADALGAEESRPPE